MIGIAALVFTFTLFMLPASWTVIYFSVSDNKICTANGGQTKFNCHKLGDPALPQQTPDQVVSFIGIQ